MENKTRFIAVGAMAFGALGMAERAAALGGGTWINHSQLIVTGGCFIDIYYDPMGSADIELVSGSFDRPSGSYFFSVTPNALTGSPAFTVADLQACGVANVTNLVQDGANGTFSTDNYYGLRFRATDPNDGLTYDFEYAFSGVSNTQTIITKTRLVAPPSTTSPDEALISGLQSQRMNHLLQSQPDLTPLLDAGDTPQVTMAPGETGLTAGFVTGPFWGQFSASWSSAGSLDSRYLFGSFGGHTRIGNDFAVGAMVQADHISQSDLIGEAKGDGWLVGPYAIARLPGQALTFEGRALWGRTDNDITPAGAATDNVDGIRSLVLLRASTRIDSGAFEIRPRASFAHVREATDAFTDSAGTPIPSITSAINQGEIGISVSRDFSLSGGDMRISGTLDGIWTNTTSGPDVSYEGGRARLGLGLSYVTAGAGTFTAGAYFDGLAQDGYEGRGLTLAYNLQF